MATRQYIGARYVPKFYTNSVDDSTQWQANVVYEPLTYVTLTNGHMYISKKQVPATVGTPAENAEYWLDIGSYNGMIEELQDQIDDIVTDVTDLSDYAYKAFKDKDIYILGDSLSNITINPPNWTVSFQSTLGNIAHSITNNSEGGRTIQGGATALSALSGVNCDILIVFLGTNDFGNAWNIGSGYSDTSTTTTCGALNNLNSAIQSAFTHYPDVYFVTPPKRSDKTANTKGLCLESYIQCIQRYCVSKNWNIINLNAAPNLLPATYTSDGLHITSAYAPKLSEFIIKEIVAGGTGIIDQKSAGVNLVGIINSGLSGSLGYTQQGNVVRLEGRLTGTFGASPATQITNGLYEALRNTGANIDYEYPCSVFVGGAGIFSAFARIINNEIYVFADGAGTSLTGDAFFTLDMLPTWCNDVSFGTPS